MGEKVRISDLLDPQKLEKYQPQLLSYFNQGGTWQELLGYDHHVMEMQYQRAYTLYEQAEFSLAAGAFTYLTQLNPYEYRYWMGLGQSKQQEHLFAEAAVAYQLASAVEPQSPEALLNLAQCFFALQQKEKAIEACQEAIELCGRATQYKTLKQQAGDLLKGLRK